MKNKISIITVVLNDPKGLEKTINSVIEQKKYYPNIEHIIIDGNSNTPTLDIIQRYKSHIDYLVSEEDKGIYDAMNKGARCATGEALIYLNAGDFMVGDLLSNFKFAPAFLPVRFINIMGKYQTRSIRSEKVALPNGHQGIIFENKGIQYDLKYKICSDYKYFLDHGYTSDISFLNTSGHIMYDRNGVSALKVNQRDSEHFEIRKNYHGIRSAIITEIWRSSRRYLKIFLGKIGLIPPTIG